MIPLPPSLLSPLASLAVRGLLLASLCLATFATGYVRGLRSEADRHADQMASIATAGATQTATARAETARRQEASQEIAHDYKAAQARLAARPLPLAADRLLRAADHPGGGRVPADTGPAGSADASPEKLSSGPSRGPSGESEEFIRSCAADAQQVMWLQDWIEQVSSVQLSGIAPKLHQNSP